MGRKCSVEGCLSESSRQEDTGVTFHKVPTHNDIRPKWLDLCRIPHDKRGKHIVHVCSRHFLRADFCNFKGRKYMLKQGVLPSVFPWDKSKLLEAVSVKTEIKSEDNPEHATAGDPEVKQEALEEEEDKRPDNFQIKEELDIKPDVDDETPQLAEEETPLVSDLPALNETEGGKIKFAPNSKIDALDFNGVWYQARVVEVDYEENEALIHFEKYSAKYDEWISMDSPRLRAHKNETSKRRAAPGSGPKKFEVGETCLASWSESNFSKYEATVTKDLGNDTYEVLFFDGHLKTIKSSRMFKHDLSQAQKEPLFDPVQGSKQDRRDKKRKFLNVAALLGMGTPRGAKRPKLETEVKPKSASRSSRASLPAPVTVAPVKVEVKDDPNSWYPKWHKGRPVGISSTLDGIDGPKKSFIVPDPRLPENFHKHLVKKFSAMQGTYKWESIIVGPENQRFRNRSDIQKYLEETKLLPYDEKMFDFRLYKPKAKKQRSSLPHTETKPSDVETTANVDNSITMDTTKETPVIEEEKPSNKGLKIPVVDDAYKCPIEGCDKSFRRENLAQMHVKHYHPEYTKFLDSTPNVADLAYARTVGDSLDKSPVPSIKNVAPKITRTSTPKVSQASLSSAQIKTEPLDDPEALSAKNKDSEIIKLLNTKPFENAPKDDDIKPIPSGLPPDMYPDIQLKDLLNKSEGVPKSEDLNIRKLSTTRPPMGIKTILPVRTPVAHTYECLKPLKPTRTKYTRRKRTYEHVSEAVPAPPVFNEAPAPPILPPDESPLLPPLETQLAAPSTSNVIIEGGQVIKIVRMKQEEIINCTCGFTEEDGLMIQCELCFCWQHAYCNNIERESQVPDKYFCYICQNPLRQRSSRKFYHDQEWLKQGVLPTASYHTRDEELLAKRFEKLKKSHDVTGGLNELDSFLHTLNLKLKIAEDKNHPKLYLWSKPWEKHPLPEKQSDALDPPKPDVKDDLKLDFPLSNDHILHAPIIPQPEAAIESQDCRLNLLEHIVHSQSLVEERLEDFEKQIEALEEGLTLEKDENYPRTRQTLEMLLRDMNKLQEFSVNTSI